MQFGCHEQFRRHAWLLITTVVCGAILVPGQSGEGSCPPGFPLDAGCQVCGSDDDCRGPGETCEVNATFSSQTQEIALRCRFTDVAVSSTAHGVYISCQGPDATGMSTCEFLLPSTLGDTVTCSLTECATPAGSSGGICQQAECGCTPGPCANAGIASLAGGMSGAFGWSCQPDNTCSFAVTGLPVQNVRGACKIGQCLRAASSPGSDQGRLLTLKSSFTNGEQVLQDWGPGDESPCQWSGVECAEDGKVARIVLYGMGLEGSIPEEGWQLPDSLNYLSLTFNRLNGTLPAAMGLPEGLQQLFLVNNELTGTIPPNWELPPALQLLWMDYNSLSGSLPPGWVLPPNLTELALGEVGLGGSIPPSWQLPPGLEVLNMWGNQLEGSIPGGWRLPPTMQRLGLDSNALTGTVPPDWVLPPSLTSLNISGNNLSGPLPDWSASPAVKVYVRPGNPDLCAEVIIEGQLYDSSTGQMNSSGLPLCDTVLPAPAPTLVAATGRGGTSSVGAIAGGVVGGILAMGGTAGLAWAYRRCLFGDTKAALPPGTAGLEAEAMDMREACAAASVVRSHESLPSIRSSMDTLRTDVGCPVALAARACFSASMHSITSGPLSAAVHPKQQSIEVKEEQPAEESSTEPANSWDMLHSLTGPRVQDSSAMEEEQPTPRMPGGSINVLDLRVWLIDYESLRMEEEIGAGSFGRVYLAHWQQTQVAVKVMHGAALDQCAAQARSRPLTLSNPVLENLHKEAGLMASLRHPNVLSFLGVCPSPPCVVTEFCSKGSLADVLRYACRSEAAAAELHWGRRLSMLLDASRGMLYLHSRRPPVVHRDLKSPNLLADGHWRVKVADFNLARILEDTAIRSSSQPAGAGNPRWLAPEVLVGESPTRQSDVFSFGMVLWEVLTWGIPYPSLHHWKVVQHVVQGGRPSIPPLSDLPGCGAGEPRDALLDGYLKLMTSCWSQSPANRPGFEEITDALAHLRGLALG